MKKQISLRTALFIAVIAVLIGVITTKVISGDTIFDQLNKFKDVLSLTDKYYVEEVDSKKLTEAAITGLLSQLDPHSVYMPAVTTAAEAERFQGSYQGVGMQIASLNDTITVVEPMGGGPAAALGILSNDRIVKINDSTAVGLTTAQASSKLRGPKGTRVHVTIVRSSEKDPLEYEITRDIISLTSIDASFMLNTDIGYVSLNRFSATTTQEMTDALTKLQASGMKRLVLDLRGNPGGYLNQAVQVADLFLSGGKETSPHTIVYTKGRVREFEESYAAVDGQPFEKTPVIILINNASASASEIVSGAIQDWDRGLIVGETSFGKGLVQRQWGLSDGSSVRLTIAKYYTPSGRLIQRSYTGKDRDQYRNEAFQRNEKEGENLQHSRDSGSTKDSSAAKFKTGAGRIVYGGGGITPDYIIKPLDLTVYTENLLRRDLFFPFVSSYLDEAGKDIRSKYSTQRQSFMESFQVTDEMMGEFKNFLIKKEVKIDEDSLKVDLAYYKARLKGYVARSLFGNEGWYSVLLSVDTQLQKAVKLFPEAEKIAGLATNRKGKSSD